MKRYILTCFVFLALCGSSFAQERVSIDVANSPVIGAKNAKVTIIEFIDFQ